jgi:hypothetical protein
MSLQLSLSLEITTRRFGGRLIFPLTGFFALAN